MIPYLSRLPSVDMLGLNDPEVTNFIYLPDELVGHRHLAPLDLLERRRVNFLIAFPVGARAARSRRRVTVSPILRDGHAHTRTNID